MTYHDLINCGISHAQFETIHPFLDGKGRVGRLLITFQLREREVLQKPLLYLSCFCKQNRAECYDRLSTVRENGDWEGWLRFFLTGVYEVSLSAAAPARAVLDLQSSVRSEISRRFLKNDARGSSPAALLTTCRQPVGTDR
ncbi:MAG: Fic family protein [Actinobacteria bacterium]|nr:Fic family protein [Actinomycetota bacterium]MBU1945050.1 Fic family protein [Actinomycetota bacterium]MBU2686614.1 Fic family protein [Actinomycetota bacterium]